MADQMLLASVENFSMREKSYVDRIVRRLQLMTKFRLIRFCPVSMQVGVAKLPTLKVDHKTLRRIVSTR